MKDDNMLVTAVSANFDQRRSQFDLVRMIIYMAIH